MEGTFRKDRHAGSAALPAGNVGRAPVWFDDEMREEWRRVTRDSVLKQILNQTHRPTLIHHCLLYKRFLQDARDERHMTSTERQTYHSIQMQMGWTPSSSSKLRMPDAQPTGNRFAALRSA